MASNPHKISSIGWRKVLIQFIAVALLIAAPLEKNIAEASPSLEAKSRSGGLRAEIDTCTGGTLIPMAMPPMGAVKDLEITAPCQVPPGTYYYGNVNIYQKSGAATGGVLLFQDGKSDFWANSILVENGGSLRAGVAQDGTEPGPDGCNGTVKPFGCNGTNVLTIHLYGAEDVDRTNGKGIACKEGGECGVPEAIWNSNKDIDVNSCNTSHLPGGGTDSGVNDCFYPYHPLNYDGGNKTAYFGYKVLAISYGGSLQLFGAKGAAYDTATNGDPSKCNSDPTKCGDPSSSGTSWARLNADLTGNGTETTITLDRPIPTWKKDDQIVITSTDYMPGHAELLTLSPLRSGNTITVTTPVQYAHVGHRFPLESRMPNKVPGRLKLDPTFYGNGIETRAAVALLSRSIRIVSGGLMPGMDLPAADDPSTARYFGGHTITRQGVKLFHVQGVEFYQLGEGGKIGHYPVHFHLARKTKVTTNPTLNQVAFVKDSSVWDSMTRWYVIHGTHDVTLARNVGYESIGHGYYLEDATEIDNKLYSNLGVLARAAVKNAQNPRQVPGILAAPFPSGTGGAPGGKLYLPQEFVPYHSDIDHPSVFWMTNGWNDFEYNMAAGATGCGVCYWLVPAWNSGASGKQHWDKDSYAGEQSSMERASTTPLEKFLGNYCSGAMNSFQTVGNTAACDGIVRDPDATVPNMSPIPNPFEGVGIAPDGIPKFPESNTPGPGFPLTPDQLKDLAVYYPNVVTSIGRFATRCPVGKDCTNNADVPDAVPRCAAGTESKLANCMATVLDHYTTSFNWANFSFAALWLRPQWYLVINSAITDVQGGGLTFITGGGYTDSDEIPGHWGLAYKTVFVGQTQPGNPYTDAGGPFNPTTAGKTGKFQLACAPRTNGSLAQFDFCLDQPQGVSFPGIPFGGNQRLFNIYDGPSYQDSNAYLDIKKTGHQVAGDDKGLDCKAPTGCAPNPPTSYKGSGWFNAQQIGTARDNMINSSTGDDCYLPNAAIAWKQPNGFYYPPAFHSSNLFFDNVDIRHYVISPLFKSGTFVTDPGKVKDHYCSNKSDMFNNWTDIDRQTELSDDDGSLTGFANSISVNLDPFFTAPVEGIECESGPYLEPLNSGLPPGTVKTSPYDYVTTAIYPKCLASEQSMPPRNGEKCSTDTAAVLWDIPCDTPACYGLPLYRQYLTNEEKNGPPMPVAIPTPSIRLAGQEQGQRSGLTVNNASYYIDTSEGADIQIPGPGKFRNIFQNNNTYYTYFLFAKPNTNKDAGKPNNGTKQTYHIYVGKDENWKPIDNVQMVRALFPSYPYTFKQGAWPAANKSMKFPGWKRDATESGDSSVGYNPSTGIETIVVDMNNYDVFTTAYNNVKSCAPAGFCAPTNGTCTCQLSNTDPLFNDCQYVCSNWANKDVKCPDGGCFGFSIKLSDKFATIAKDQPRPQPTPLCFPNEIFNIPVMNVGSDLAGTCSTAVIPPFQMCD